MAGSFNYLVALNKVMPDSCSNIEFVCIFGEKANEVIIVMKDDNVFAFGSNKNGCLGLKNNNSAKDPTKVIELCNKQIVDISYGYYHCVALTKTGRCYSWGHSSYGQLGNGNTANCFEPKLIDGLNDIIDIRCGYYHTMALTKSGKLYGFGYNVNGEIGCGHHVSQLTPIRVVGLDSYRIVSICCGAHHSMALTENKQVYSWGYNGYGQLGIGNNQNRNVPTKVILSDEIVVRQLACGFHHSLLLTSEDEIFSFGLNESGQLGNGSNINQNIPSKMENQLKFTEMTSHSMSNISIGVSKNDFCYVWGECSNEVVTTPKETPFKSVHNTFAVYSKIKRTLQSKCPALKSQTNRIIESLSKSFNNPEKCDFRIKVEGKYIYVNKTILKHLCKHFESMLSENWSESESNQMEITDYSYDVYYAFIKYLYTDIVDIKPEDAIELLDLANCYLEEELKQKCIQIIKSEISIENICSVYSLAVKYESQQLEDFCFNFASNKMNEIYKTESFQKMNKKVLLKFINRIGDNKIFK